VVEIGAPRVGVLGRDHAAADVALGNHDRVTDPHAPSAPPVLLMRLDALDPEVHPEAALVDRGDPELLREAAERRRRKQRRGAAATPVGRRQLRLDKPDRLADELRHCLSPRTDEDADRPRPLVERGLDLRPTLYLAGDQLAVCEAQTRGPRSRRRSQRERVAAGRSPCC